jgi:hypothetical protein
MIKRLDLESTCPKCWATADRIQVKYDADFSLIPLFVCEPEVYVAEEAARQPFMKRTCSRCEYWWKELPLDAEGDTND